MKLTQHMVRNTEKKAKCEKHTVGPGNMARNTEKLGIW
jgi:hypothetical protein